MKVAIAGHRGFIGASYMKHRNDLEFVIISSFPVDNATFTKTLAEHTGTMGEALRNLVENIEESP